MSAAAAMQPDGAGAPAPMDHVPDVGAFGMAVAPQAAKSRTIKRLYAELSKLDSQAGQLEREASLIRLATWVKKGGAPPEMPGVALGERAQVKRFRLLCAALEAFPAFCARVAYVVGATLLDQRADAFSSRMGIPGDRGLFSETIDRLSRRLMPQPIDEQDVTHTLALMFPSKADIEWLSSIPADVTLRFLRALKRPGV